MKYHPMTISTMPSACSRACTERPASTGPVRLKVSVVPGATRPGIAGWLGTALKVRVTAAPEQGRANLAVEKLIADALNLGRSEVRIISGARSRHKTLEIAGLTQAEVATRLRNRCG